MREKVSFVFNRKKVSIVGRKCGFFSFGLMFRARKTQPCIFKFKKNEEFKISSLFVGFSFIAVWLDDKNKVIEIKKILPFTISASPKKPYKTLVEIPLNNKNAKIILDLTR